MNHSDRDRWLYVSAFMPLANARHAGGRVAFENLCALRHSHAYVDAVICTTEPELTAPASPDLRVFRQDGRSFTKYLLRTVGSMNCQRMLASPILHTRLHSACQQELERLMRTHSYAGLFSDFTQSGLLVQRAAVATGCTAPLTLCAHDLFVQRLSRSPKLLDRWLTGPVLQEELRLLTSVQRVITLSEKDRQLAQTLYALPCVDVKPFVAPDWCARVQRNQIDPQSLLFFANFERSENRRGACWFVKEVFPKIRQRRPGVSLTLAGNGSDSLAKDLDCEGVIGTGYVDDPSPHFSRCALAIAPLLEGAGVKFKVLEALSSGVPVVGTPIAAEGIPAQQGLTICRPAEFARCAVQGLSSGGAQH